MKRADSLLAPLIRNLGIEDSLRLGRIKKEWPDFFGKPVSIHTSPAAIKNGDLLINVDSPAWMQQLGYYKDAIAEKLRGFGVRAVRFRLGRVIPERKNEKMIRKPRKITSEDKSYIERTIAPVSDLELRERIGKAIEKSIAFRGQAETPRLVEEEI